VNVGSDAVILFLVLSGYVVAHTAREKDKALGHFAFARASRLYSVAVPTIILTLILDYTGSLIDPASYHGWWWNPAPAWEVLLRSLSFTTEWTGSSFRPGTNGPFWSLSYEAAYHILFGVAMFLGGWQRILLLGTMLVLIGINVLILMPAWLCGVWLCYRGSSRSLPAARAWFCFVGPLVL